MKPYLVGLSGGSASGKSRLTNALKAYFQEAEIEIVAFDNYYLPLSRQKADANGLVNFDQPEAMDIERFLTDLKSLVHGQTVELLEYNFNNPNWIPKKLIYRSAPIILVEGVLIYAFEELRNYFDLKIFVEAEDHVRIGRRLTRDIAERGLSFGQVIDEYQKFVAPMYRNHVEPYKWVCDVVLPNHQENNKGLSILIDHFRRILSERKELMLGNR